MRMRSLLFSSAALSLVACTGGAMGGGAGLPEGAVIAATFATPVASRQNHVGDKVTVTVSRDVADSAGQVVIPAGATIDLTITALEPASHKGGEGTLTFDVGDVTVGGTSHGLDAEVVDFAHEMKGTGVGAAEVGKTAVGGVAGAVIGHAVGGDKGTAVGAVGGAAAGAAVADYSQDRDIVVAKGNRITLKLTSKYSG